MSVQKDVVRRPDGTARTTWRVRWQEGQRWRSKSFALKKDALAHDARIRLARRQGTLATLDAGTETLTEYVAQVWATTYATDLAQKTKQTYMSIYDTHIDPHLGAVQLRAFNPELIARWQAERIASGAGPVSVRQALGLLGNILQRALEGGRITSNPARLVRKHKVPKSPETRPLAPATVEAIRGNMSPRDAVLVSLMAYAGLRPGEALALRWSDIRGNTILIERAVSLGEEKDTKTSVSRTVRLLDPLAHDLNEWRLRSGRPGRNTLVIPGRQGKPWTESAYKAWRRQAFFNALSAALGGAVDDPLTQRCGTCQALTGNPCRTPGGKALRTAHIARRRTPVEGRPYDLRHSFASLLLHEGRSVVYVARQLGHGAQLTLSRYGHVIEELEDSPQLQAEVAIRAARSTGAAIFLPSQANQTS